MIPQRAPVRVEKSPNPGSHALRAYEPTLPLQGRAIAYGDRSLALVSLRVVMAGLVPAIHVVRQAESHVDARDKPGHDGVTNRQNCPSGEPRISICDSPALQGRVTAG
ncbi:protein of unknown function [Bradyrhizobium sp. ORS 285]|nr:hypothetical protein BRAO285_460006 [Bradyrhizobium sp. ORS 285]SMX61412.1 protein of unknown function [Bradyrhizobium sp. ORS 285]